jgi:gamma-glutamyl hydrolase
MISISIQMRYCSKFPSQFHPEKNLYEWVRNKNISHTSSAIISSSFFAEFFVNEARKSGHHFKDAKTEDDYVIYNFPVTFTGKKGSSFEQSYMFPANVDYTNKATGTYRFSIFVLAILSVLKLMF